MKFEKLCFITDVKCRNIVFHYLFILYKIDIKQIKTSVVK